MITRVVVLGEIGSGNLGDDLGFIVLRDELLRSFRSIDREIHVDVLTPSRFSNLDHLGHVIVVAGCGTLLDERCGEYVRRLATMQDRATTTCLFGTGISDPSHLPPTSEGQQLLKSVVEKAKHGWIRGRSGPDFLWAKGWTGADQRSATIGINMGYAAYSSVDLEAIWSKVRSLTWHLRAKGHDVLLVSAWSNDNVWFRRDFPGEKVLQVNGTKRSLEELGRLKALISFRGHLGVVAACAGVSVMPIEFSSKIRDMYLKTNVSCDFLDPAQDDWVDRVESALGGAPVDNQEAIRTAGEFIRKRMIDFACEVRAQHP